MALRRENVRAWHEVEQDFVECEYRAVRDRQMKELEQEDDLLSKIPVRCVVFDRLRRLLHFLTAVQKFASKTVQRILRICPPATRTMPFARCLVRECYTPLITGSSRYREKASSTLAFLETSAISLLSESLSSI